MPVALLLSLVLHLVVAAWLVRSEGRQAIPPAASRTVELEVIEAPAPSPTVAAAPSPAPKPSPAPAARPSEPRKKRSPDGARPAPAQGAPESRLAAGPKDETGDGIPVAAPPLDRAPDAPLAGASGQGSLNLGLSGGAARRILGADRDSGPEREPQPAPTEKELVKARLDSMFAEARNAQRNSAADGAVAGLGRGFEQAARRGAFAPDLQRWVDAALAKYREGARRFGQLGKDDSTDAWARIQDRALRGLDRGEATYVAVVEIRQAADGSLVNLRLVVSSGAREFDVRALGSVADGLSAEVAATVRPRPEGTLSLWALLGDRQTDSEAVRAVQKAYRYALLDVDDPKPTLIDLERAGHKEQLRFSARLLASF